MPENGETQVAFTPDQQSLVDKLVGEARVKAREIAAAEVKTKHAKDEEAASQANLAAKEEWEKLASTHKARVKELEPLVETLKGYQAVVERILKDTVKGLGDKAKSAVAGLPETMGALEKLEWLNKNKALFQEAAGAGVGTPGRPRDKTSKDKLKASEISKFPIRL